MYEASFGLKRRPFAATPDASCFLSAGPIQAALDELVVCVEQGQGIAILTAPAGTGKTLLCERLRSELGDRYETVFLRHASFLTRRALLQTVLCELNHQYHHPSEQELRLELFPAIRALQPKREALVLICDEAHQLTDSLLEELRILADFAEAGRPLVRLVLVGQLALEEKLAQPSLEAFNQRIRAHINLSTFDHAGSLDYIDYRVTWAGGRTDEVFTPEALDLIARASDGVPRCINQLADHSLLLAFVAEQHPASEELVREALSDLRQLPLHWNEPAPSRSSAETTELHNSRLNDTVDTVVGLPVQLGRDSSGLITASKTTAPVYSFEPNVGDDTEVIDFTSELQASVLGNTVSRGPAMMTHDTVTDSTDVHQIEVGSEDWRQAVELFNPHKSEPSGIDDFSDLLRESARINGSYEDRSKLKHRIDFHNLLQDAYNNAEDLHASTIDRVEATESSSASLPDHSECQTASQIVCRTGDEVVDSLPCIISASPALAVTQSTGFHEEIIVDRYASIDAGFEPPAILSTDTAEPAVVRAEPLATETITETTLSITAGFADNRMSEPLRDQSIENLAAEVYSLGESLRPSDSLSSSSESILHALRQEVGGTSEMTAVESFSTPGTAMPIASESETAWDAIETPLPPPVVESRPFRYLFSSLRRKQQGLS
jgi:type II secretory pathway predicted ATPase ExeA